MLKSLKLHGVGPVRDLNASFGQRLNVFTGDNGLGKSFLLDVCFWALTGTWPGNRTAIPDRNFKSPKISYDIKSKTKSASREAKYDFKTQTWSRQRGRPPMPGLVIYAAVDGSFAVWDPARNYWRDFTHFRPPDKSELEWPRAFQFPPESWPDFDEPGTASPIRRDVANGLEEYGHVLCNGLIADWSEWFYQRSSKPSIDAFAYLEEVVAALSHPLEPIRCSEPKKVFLADSRKFPTLQMPYGVVPYPHWSSGVKRIVNLAYLIVWSWVEHVQAADLRKEDSTNRIVVIVDEVEAHLHPKWQRTILPALLQVVNKLRKGISVQMLAATHSPLVLASLEPCFEARKDQFFCFDLKDTTVAFRNPDWVKFGDVVDWLTSPIFELQQARSREAEEIIEIAKAFLRDEVSLLPAGLKSKSKIDSRLREVLGGDDPFLVRWQVSTGGAK